MAVVVDSLLPLLLLDAAGAVEDVEAATVSTPEDGGVGAEEEEEDDDDDEEEEDDDDDDEEEDDDDDAISFTEEDDTGGGGASRSSLPRFREERVLRPRREPSAKRWATDRKEMNECKVHIRFKQREKSKRK